MRLRPSHLLFLILVIAFVGGVWFFFTKSKQTETNPAAVEQKVNIANSKTLCAYQAPEKHLFLNDIYLPRIISGFSKALLLPEADASCLPSSFSGTVDFLTVQSSSRLPFALNHSLDLALTKFPTQYTLSDFANDKKSLENLGYTKFDQLKADLKNAYGDEALKGNFLWVGIQPLKISWSRRNYKVPAFHPLATTIGKAEVQSLLKQNAQLVDLREKNDGDAKIPGAIVFKDFDPEMRLRLSAPDKTDAYSTLFSKLNPDIPVILFDKNEVHFSAYNFATILSAQKFKKIYIFRGGYDEWADVPVLTPTDLGVKIVTGAELVDLRKKKQLLIIDVRNPGSYKYRHVLDAKRATVGWNLNNRGIASMIEVMPDQIPVIMGEDEYDWRPYRLLKNLFKIKPELAKKVLWYRGGMSDARFLETMRVYMPDSERLKIGPHGPDDYEKTNGAGNIIWRNSDFKSYEDKL